MTMSETKDGRIKRLPKWAQDLILAQQRAIHDQRDQIAALKGETKFARPGVFTDPYGDDVPVAAVNERVRFTLDTGSRTWLDVRVQDDGWFEIMGDEAMAILANASNVIYVKPERTLR